MALHRSKLGPVGGSGGGGGDRDGGVVVDLDPLSAFALMGQRTEGASASGGTGPGSSVDSGKSKSGTTRDVGVRREQQTSSPPVSVQPSTGIGGWRSIELNLPAPSSRVRLFIFVSAGVDVP